LFNEGDVVLDLGCGTGVDALHLQSRGVCVRAIDNSPQMVEIARRRGVDVDCCAIEHMQYSDLRVDGVISNFGALNCLESLGLMAGSLGRMVRSGGHVALCFLSDFCVWEFAYYLLCGRPRKAFRRLRGSADSSIGKVFYPSSAAIACAFRLDFRLIESCAIGLFVPPSYVKFLTRWEIEQLSRFDQGLIHKPVLRGLGDHRLYIFERK
jgi:SAM-dependent methyltransferase